MKHLKSYENLNEPKVGDYVICEDKFGDKYIAIVVDTEPLLTSWYEKTIKVRYLDNNFEEIIPLKDIIFTTKFKYDADIYLKAKKYNL